MPAPTIRDRRRRVLAVIGTLVVPPIFHTSAHVAAQGRAAGLAPTPSDVEGPFYPVRVPADRDADLTIVQGQPRAAQGTRLYLSGNVFDTSGKPLAGARVELWQCDATGHYHHVDGDQPGDPGFQGFGVAQADDQGRYGFKTIRPVAYGSRPPHLHLKVAHPEATPLTTQLYVRGDNDAADPVARAFGRSSRNRLSLALLPMSGAETGALRAEYDFVLQRRSA